MKNIGLLGGSFDPPHKGHLYISLEAKKILKLDEMWWLVTPQNPLKINQPASYSDRIKNCKLIIKNQPIKIKALKSNISNLYKNFRISSKKLHVSDFDKSPAWAIIQNKEIKISSTEIRKQREQLRSKD